MTHVSRRVFLTAGAAATLVTAHRIPAALGAAPGQTPARSLERLQPFPLSAVRLGPGRLNQEAQINARYVDSLSAERMLYSFRATAGITPRGAPYGGWEDPKCELRGHFSGGHYLSALALAAATSGNSDFRSRANAMVASLAECQTKIGTGYLSAYPPELFERLARGQEVWAPFYTYHKILAGLLDVYELSDNTEALQVAEGMAQWAGVYFQGMSTEQRQRILRTEYGGMNESLVNLAAITGQERYLHYASIFEQPGILDPLAERRDELQGLHANTNIPKVIGAARRYEVTGELRYRQIAEYFLDEVLTARSYAIGNTSLDEHWKTPPAQLQGSLGWHNAECCVAYNLMKLERLVFGWTGNARWMDEYERSLVNCRLGTQQSGGLKQYFFPLAAGYWRAYNSAEDSFWCCTGTGAEEFAKLTDTIFFHRGNDLYVNQFIAATLDWKEQGISVEQVTKFPEEPGTTLKIRSSRPTPRTLHIRIPYWTTSEARVEINGRPLEAVADPGSYLAIRRAWRDGDVVSVHLPMTLRQESLPGDESVTALLYGPMVLAADMGPGPADGPQRVIRGRPTAPDDLPPAAPLPRTDAGSTDAAESWVERESKGPLRFKAAGADKRHALLPLYQIQEQRYSVYWQTRGSQKKT